MQSPGRVGRRACGDADREQRYLNIRPLVLRPLVLFVCARSQWYCFCWGNTLLSSHFFYGAVLLLKSRIQGFLCPRCCWLRQARSTGRNVLLWLGDMRLGRHRQVSSGFGYQLLSGTYSATAAATATIAVGGGGGFANGAQHQ